jgi:hypothetical protein
MNEWRDPGAVVAIAGRGPFPLGDEGCGQRNNIQLVLSHLR